MAIVANTVFNGVGSVPLGPATVTRRVESLSEDMDQQVLRDLALCEYFTVKLDESLDVTETAPTHCVLQEDFLTLYMGEDIFNKFKKYVQNNVISLLNW